MGSITIPTIAAVGSEAAADGAAAAGGAAAASTAAYAGGAAIATNLAASGGAAAASTAAAGGAAAAPLAAASSSIFTLGNAAAAVGVLGSGISAYGQHMAGVATSNMDKQKARVEAISAGQKQIDMRQKMLASLASQNAGTLGAVGTGRGSGFGANALRQITQNQNDLMANSANESAQVSLLDQGASNATAAGNLGAAGTAIGGLAGFGKNFNGG